MTERVRAMPAAVPRLSICIATYRRGAFIEATLRSIAAQLDERCELVIVDGASPDETEHVVTAFAAGRSDVRYVREATNSGIDRDYDKAVSYARGDYCWLMTDDDLLLPGAVARVLAALEPGVDVVVVNAEVRTIDLARQLKPHLLDPRGTRRYDASQLDAFLAETGRYLSFIGAAVVRRTLWLGRDRAAYFGSLFIHVGVIFQAPAIAAASVVREPSIAIRYGNAMWTARTFEIWMLKWPALIWSFEHRAAWARRTVTAREPYLSPTGLVWHRATGGYAMPEFDGFLAARLRGPGRWLAVVVARMPARLANALCGVYCWARIARPPMMAVYDLARATPRTPVAAALARRLHIG